MTAQEWYRKNTVRAQRDASEQSAKARSYVAALCVYHMIPDELRRAAAMAQVAHAESYEAARSWATTLSEV